MTSPVFETVIRNVAVVPYLTRWMFGSFTILIAGWGCGWNGAVFTGAVSESLTFCPVGDGPTTVARFTKPSVTFGRVQVYVFLAPAAIVPRSRLQFGDSGSVTATSWRATSPLFVTVIVKLAVPPIATVCELGSLVMSTDGCETGAGGGVNGVVTVTGALPVAVSVGPLGGDAVTTATFVKLAVTFASVQV